MSTAEQRNFFRVETELYIALSNFEGASSHDFPEKLLKKISDSQLKSKQFKAKHSSQDEYNKDLCELIASIQKSTNSPKEEVQYTLKQVTISGASITFDYSDAVKPEVGQLVHLSLGMHQHPFKTIHNKSKVVSYCNKKLVLEFVDLDKEELENIIKLVNYIQRNTKRELSLKSV